MAEEPRYEFLAEFDRSLRTVSENPDHNSVSFHRKAEGRYFKAFDLPRDLNIWGGEPALLSDREHTQWNEPLIEMDEKQAKKWIREKVSRIFSEPEALWGGN